MDIGIGIIFVCVFYLEPTPECSTTFTLFDREPEMAVLICRPNALQEREDTMLQVLLPFVFHLFPPQPIYPPSPVYPPTPIFPPNPIFQIIQFFHFLSHQSGTPHPTMMPM